MKEFIEIVFGDYSTAQLFGFVWFFLIGYILYGLTEVTGRNVESPNTPKKWSWKFWFKDNMKRYVVTILTTYILFRFYVEFSGHEFGNFDALTLGLIGDGIGATAKKRIKKVMVDRKKIMEKEGLE